MTTINPVKTSSSRPLLLLNGIAALLIGILLVIAPQMTSTVLIGFMGFFLLISGIFAIVWIFIPNREIAWGWLLTYGILGIIAGLLTLNHPLWSGILALTLIVTIISIEAIMMGIINIVVAFGGGGWGTGILGLLLLVFGVLLLFNLEVALAIPFLLGILGILAGIFLIISFFTSKGKTAPAY